MKKLSKIASFVLIVMMMLTISTNVMAAITSPGGVDTKSTKVTTEGVETIGNSIVTTISTIGMIVSVLVLIILGIKYMMGSAEEKAEYKKTLIPYIIGASLVFAATAIATAVFNFSTSVVGQ